MEPYDHKKIEQKWQQRWEESNAFRVDDASDKPKEYLLIEFPYPSGDGLHVGHVRSWTALDVVARKHRAQGKNVLYPIGWDAFGLPAENYAIKTGVHPKITTKQNTDNFRRQIKNLGISFDWSREVDTTDPAYYKWTQWIFLQLFKKGLAYKTKTFINWCPKDKVTLANEEVVDGACERCGTPVEKREKEQWMLAITKYAQRLYDDLDTVDYITAAKVGQRNWIAPSEGAEIEFTIANSSTKIVVFTTRADTLFGATFLVLAPEHPLLKELSVENTDELAAYILEAKKKTEIERTNDEKEKTGVELKGVKAINPANGEEIPMFVADYVLGHYGTGAIMAVPAHDERDNAFAKKFNVPVKLVVSSRIQVTRTKLDTTEGYDATYQVAEYSSPLNEKNLQDLAKAAQENYENGFEHPLGPTLYTNPGILINSGQFDGLTSEEAKKKITEAVGGKIVTTFKLRDWVFGRQRYWGEPIPLVHCEKDGWVAVPDSQLPVILPETDIFLPGTEGESPLANMDEWVNTTCPTCGGAAKRETDVMPQWAGSSWYYLRYADPRNADAFASEQLLRQWSPVNWYNGGMEHTTLHLLYSRFWHKFLYDIGLVPTTEPYMKRTSHGLILAEDGSKMSKSKGNTVSPDTLVEQFGADSLRLYEMFIGPFDQPVLWNTNSVVGVRRFLERVWKLRENVTEVHMDGATETRMHQTIKKISDDIDALKMNTVVSALMMYSNHLAELKTVPKTAYVALLQLLTPVAPHISHELAEGIELEHAALEKWPVYDPAKLQAETATIAVQVNGKVRGTVELAADATEDEALGKAREHTDVAAWLAKGREVKAVYVPGRIINFVVE
ncbi:MAG: class I tRNA ligase family protein [Candidatus Adlerbacteria bacterium]